MEMLNLLLESHADLHANNHDGEAPWHYLNANSTVKGNPQHWLAFQNLCAEVQRQRSRSADLERDAQRLAQELEETKLDL